MWAAHSHLWAWKELTSNRHDLRTPPPPLHHPSTAVHPSLMGTPLRTSTACCCLNSFIPWKSPDHSVTLATLEWQTEYGGVQAWLPISHNPALVVPHPLCEIPLDMPVAMQSLGSKRRRTGQLNAAQIPHMCLDLIYRIKCLKDYKHGCL